MKNILCFGDSNTWGYNPLTKERFSKEIRWTGRLQSMLENRDINIIEDGVCGRTTIYEDAFRPNRKGIDSILELFGRKHFIDGVVLMLGTNDCKTYNNSTSEKIAGGIDQCLEVILDHVPAQNVLLVSPILLGENVWKEEYDPEFNENSVTISKELKNAYEKVARRRKVRFIAASDYVIPSKEDQEHLDANGHSKFARVIFDEFQRMIS